MPKYYPTAPKDKIKDNIRALYDFFLGREQQKQRLDLSPLVSFKDSYDHKEWEKHFKDGWQNSYANLGTGNSLMQHSQFILQRIGYPELAKLSSCDDIISNAMDILVRECLSKWGHINVELNDDILSGEARQEKANEIIEYLENRLKELNLRSLLYTACKKAFGFGGVGIYLAFKGNQDLSKEVIISRETKDNKLIDIRVVEPWLFAPSEVNFSNPLESDYMRPQKWYVTGAGMVHTSRLLTLQFFEVADLIKPLYNFMGISLCQLMLDKVKSADSIRQSLSDMFLRFRTAIIKTPALMSADKEELKQRIEIINMSENNFGKLILRDDEEYINSITSISGYDKIQAQAYETIAASARIPINKLFGQTPTGLNNSGAYDLQSFYDTIQGFQNTTIKPFIEKILNILLNEIDFKGLVSFEFESPMKLSALDESNQANLEADFYIKLINAGVISQDEALLELQRKGFLDKNINVSGGEDIDEDIQNALSGLSDLDNG